MRVKCKHSHRDLNMRVEGKKKSPWVWQGRAVSGVRGEGFGKGGKGFANVYNSFPPFPMTEEN